MWALGAPAGHAHEPSGLGAYVEPTMALMTQLMPPSDAPWTRPGGFHAGAVGFQEGGVTLTGASECQSCPAGTYIDYPGSVLSGWHLQHKRRKQLHQLCTRQSIRRPCR